MRRKPWRSCAHLNSSVDTPIFGASLWLSPPRPASAPRTCRPPPQFSPSRVALRGGISLSIGTSGAKDQDAGPVETMRPRSLMRRRWDRKVLRERTPSRVTSGHSCAEDISDGAFFRKRPIITCSTITRVRPLERGRAASDAPTRLSSASCRCRPSISRWRWASSDRLRRSSVPIRRSAVKSPAAIGVA